MLDDHNLLKLAKGMRDGHHCWIDVIVLYCFILFGSKHWILVFIEFDNKMIKVYDDFIGSENQSDLHGRPRPITRMML